MGPKLETGDPKQKTGSDFQELAVMQLPGGGRDLRHCGIMNERHPYRISNAFSTSPQVQAIDDDDNRLSAGTRSLVSDFARADRVERARDPFEDRMKTLTARKTQLGYAKQAAEQLRDKFLDGEGSDLFEKDPITGKLLKNLDGTYADRMGAEIDGLRRFSKERVGVLRGVLTSAGRDEPTERAREAARQLSQREPLYKAKLGKWGRIETRLKLIEAAAERNELALGRMATARLEQAGVLRE